MVAQTAIMHHNNSKQNVLQNLQHIHSIIQEHAMSKAAA